MIEKIQHHYGNGVLKLLYYCRGKFGEKACNICIGKLDKVMHSLIYKKHKH